MTRRYANLLTEDLQAVHQKVSLLATLFGSVGVFPAQPRGH
jgi:hypothetical protein